MEMQTKLATAVLLGFVLVVAAACGGGSDQATIDQLETALAAAEEARTEAEQEAAEAEKKAADEEAARKTAEAAGAQKAAEDKKKADADAAAAAKAKADAEAEQKRLEKKVEDAEKRLTEAEQAELRARASSFGEQLSGPGQGPATVLWTRGNNLTFRPQGIVLTPGSAAPSVPGGWRSASFTGHTGQTGTADTLVDETVYLYTNIQQPSSRAFWKVHGQDGGCTRSGR